MSARKSGTPPTARRQDGASGVARWLAGTGRHSVGLVLLLAAFAAIWTGVWRSVRTQVLASEGYWLRQADIDITPRPEWIRCDVRAEVFRDASLKQPLSLIDPQLVEQLAQAFALHPWIKQVVRVEKSFPAKAYVDLLYRRPAAMVAVPGGFYPVDDEGVLLPTADFAGPGPGDYPRVVGVDTIPLGPVGTPWGDLRVAGAAAVAAAVGELWCELGLERIVPVKTETATTSDYSYELLAANGARIIWGSSPRLAAANEASVEEKLGWLKGYLAQHGPIDKMKPPGAIDLRRLGLNRKLAASGGR